jgi:DNA-binding CsgD family transcriptional regulator
MEVPRRSGVSDSAGGASGGHAGQGDGASELAWVVSAVHAIVGTEMTAGVCFRSEGGRLRVRAAHTVNVPDAGELVRRCHAVVQSLCDGPDISARPSHDAAPLAPGNEVLVYAHGEVANDTDPCGPSLLIAPLAADKRHDQICVMLCQGPLPLAWLGGWQTTRFADEQRRRLGSLVGPLRQRLVLEHDVADAPRTAAALGAALEAIGAPAFVVDARGSVLHLNRAGRSLRDRDRAGIERSLVAAARGERSDPPWQLSRLRGDQVADGFLAVLRSPGTDAARNAMVRMAAARWRLTARQQEVLELLARGVANATVADALAISERTVEFHVTAILDKAGADSRTSLLARLLDG